jgi:hypothetical protein
MDMGMDVCLKGLNTVKTMFKTLKRTEIPPEGELYYVVVRWNRCGGT